MRSLVVVSSLAALVGVAGCGTPGQGASVHGTVDAFLRNCERGDGPSAMEVLVEPAQRVFEAQAGARAGCARILGADPEGARTEAVTVDSELARAEVRTRSGETRALELTFGSEGWRIEGPH